MIIYLCSFHSLLSLSLSLLSLSLSLPLSHCTSPFSLISSLFLPHSLFHSPFHELYTFPCSFISPVSTSFHLMYINERNIIILYCHYVTDLFTMLCNTIVHVYTSGADLRGGGGVGGGGLGGSNPPPPLGAAPRLRPPPPPAPPPPQKKGGLHCVNRCQENITYGVQINTQKKKSARRFAARGRCSASSLFWSNPPPPLSKKLDPPLCITVFL